MSDQIKTRILVTGTNGTIGNYIAKRYESLGFEVHGIDVELSRESIRNTHIIDLSNFNDSESSLREIFSKFSFQYLVNCHGIQRRKSLSGSGLDDWEKIVNTNLRSCWQTTVHFCSQDLSSSDRSIVNVSSINGVVVGRSGPIYGISKAGLNHLTKVSAIEYAPNIRVNAVAPTAIPSKMTSDLFSSQSYINEKLSTIPLEKFVEPEDVYFAVNFLLTEQSRLITGHILNLDGGLSLR